MAYRQEAVILDTDFESDSDDVFDLKSLLALESQKQINLLGVIVSTSDTWAPGAVDGIARHYGRTDLPLGSWNQATFAPGGGSPYTQTLYNELAHPNVGLHTTVTHSTAAYRTMLAAVPCRRVTIIATGHLNALDALLASAADGISSLNGSDLIAAKVRKVVVVAGTYPTNATPEWNLAKAPAASAAFVAGCPVPIVFAGIEMGDTVVMGTAVKTGRPSTDPVRRAMQLGGTLNTGRYGWGVMGVLWAINRQDQFTTVRGTCTVNATTGANSWVNGAAGNHYYAVKSNADAFYVTRGDGLIGTQLGAVD